MKKIAITTEDGNSVFAHFGKTPYFAVVTIDDGKITGKELRPNVFTQHGRNLMNKQHQHHDHGAGGEHQTNPSDAIGGLSDCVAIVTGGAGGRIRQAMAQAGLQMIITDETSVDAVVNQFIAGDLIHVDRTCDGKHH